jgi:hypothetical protein
MPWATLASNQMVSYTDAQGGGFTLQPGQSAVTSNQCMTKSDATTKYVLDTSYLTSYASNQLIPKSVWVAGSTTITVIWQAAVGCLTASWVFRKNGVTQASGGGFNDGTFTCVVGDVLVAEMTSGIKGIGCSFAATAIERNGVQVASDNQSGFNVTSTSTWTVTSGTASVNMYAGAIA